METNASHNELNISNVLLGVKSTNPQHNSSISLFDSLLLKNADEKEANTNTSIGGFKSSNEDLEKNIEKIEKTTIVANTHYELTLMMQLRGLHAS